MPSIYQTLKPINVKESNNNIKMITSLNIIESKKDKQVKTSIISSEILGKNLNSCIEKCEKELDNKNHAPSDKKTAVESIISSLYAMLPTSLTNQRRLNDIKNACDIGCMEIDKGNIAEKNFMVGGDVWRMTDASSIFFPIRPSQRIDDLRQIVGRVIPSEKCKIGSDLKCGWNSKCIDGTCKIKKMCFKKFGRCAGSDTNNQNIDPSDENLIPSKLNVRQYINEGSGIISYFEKGYINPKYPRASFHVSLDTATKALVQDIKWPYYYYGFFHGDDENECYLQTCSGKCKPSWKTAINDKKVGQAFSPLATQESFVGEVDTKLKDLIIHYVKPNTGPIPQSFTEQRRKLSELKNQSQKSINHILNKIKEINDLNLGADNKAIALGNLSKKLEKFQNERANVMNNIAQNDTYVAAAQDNQLKKRSNDLMYYVWLTLAIAILFVAIRKIK